jgi:hypothetical protein
MKEKPPQIAEIRDARGGFPNFVIYDGWLIHQKSGKGVKLPDYRFATIRAAQDALEEKI